MVSSVLRYNNCGAETLEQRRMVRNPAVPAQYPVSSSSYPRRNPSGKNERAGEDVEGSNGLQPNPQFMARKVAAAQGGSGGSQWY